uniref:Protein PLASTID REDOX INSENSITIVE 2 n=1 Tax=Ananas comosus var. bracteatus TaxID=296719 RepID=A0A6V7P709_ANACO|nr:unnamed protein product [Ananas comosus var. bracteatus]
MIRIHINNTLYSYFSLTLGQTGFGSRRPILIRVRVKSRRSVTIRCRFRAGPELLRPLTRYITDRAHSEPRSHTEPASNESVRLPLHLRPFDPARHLLRRDLSIQILFPFSSSTSAWFDPFVRSLRSLLTLQKKLLWFFLEASRSGAMGAAQVRVPRPDPQFAVAEAHKFGSELRKKLLKSKEVFGDDIDEVVKTCEQIFSDFLHKEYGGPGTLLVEPFTDMLLALKEKELPGGPVAARAALLWAQNHVDDDWDTWTSRRPQ